MKVLKALTAILGLSASTFPVAASAEDWIQLTEYVWYDRDALYIYGNRVRYWLYTDMQGVGGFVSSVTTKEIDCANYRLRWLAVSFTLSRPPWRENGNITNPDEWVYFRPDSPDGLIASLYC